MRRTCAHIAFLALSISFATFDCARAQFAGSFTHRGFGARGIGLGNAQTADVLGDASPWYNPALAPFVANQRVEAAYTFLSLDRRLEYVQFLVPLKPRAGVAAGLIHAGVSDIDGRDASGYHTDTYSTDEFAAFLIFGSRIGNRASVGISFRFYRTDLFQDLDPATSIGLSFGTTFRIRKDLYLAVAIDDLLARYEWDTSDVFGTSGRKTTDEFPVRLRLGMSHLRLDNRLRLFAEFESRLEKVRSIERGIQIVGGTPRTTSDEVESTLFEPVFRLGAEYEIMDILLLRAGIDQIAQGDLGELIPSLGFGVSQEVGELGMAFEYTFGKEAYALGTFHLISLRLNL